MQTSKRWGTCSAARLEEMRSHCLPWQPASTEGLAVGLIHSSRQRTARLLAAAQHGFDGWRRSECSSVRTWRVPQLTQPVRHGGCPAPSATRRSGRQLLVGHQKSTPQSWLGWLDSNQRMAGSKPAILTCIINELLILLTRWSPPFPLLPHRCHQSCH
jgi:hypothetical protein